MIDGIYMDHDDDMNTIKQNVTALSIFDIANFAFVLNILRNECKYCKVNTMRNNHLIPYIHKLLQIRRKQSGSLKIIKL